MIDRCQNFCHHRFHLDDLGRTMVSTLQIIQVRPWGINTYGDLGIPKFRKPPYWYSNIFYKAQQLDATGLRCQNYWVYVCLTCPRSFFCPPKSTSLKPRSHQNMMARITISIPPWISRNQIYGAFPKCKFFKVDSRKGKDKLCWAKKDRTMHWYRAKKSD